MRLVREREREAAQAKPNDSAILLCSGNGKSPPGEYSACKSIELLSIITMLPDPPSHSLLFHLFPSTSFSFSHSPAMAKAPPTLSFPHLFVSKRNEKAFWEASYEPREGVCIRPV